MIVDASVLFHALVDGETAGEIARRRLNDEYVFAPDLIDLELISALRGAERSGVLNQPLAERSLDRVMDYPIRRFPHSMLIRRIWDLRHNLSPYDASYVALAELMEMPLVTADAGLARSPGVECEIELLSLH